MLKLFYDPDISYLEVFFKKTPNYGVDLNSKIIEFRSESNDEIVGYGIHHPEKAIPSATFMPPKIKIAVICFLKRKEAGLSEKEVAARLEMSYRTYQRIEEGEISKIDDLLKISKFISNIDFSKLLKVS